MHFVLWGTSQFREGYKGYVRFGFQCTSCFGVLLNWGGIRSFTSSMIVSMHFVLWGTSQWGHGVRNKRTKEFQCTSCFGVLLNSCTSLGTRAQAAFQCTSCFGVLLNDSKNPLAIIW